MIKFFRKIRQNLLSEGKTASYFKYAIGEIVLIVIGILIALQINSWNQDRQDRKQEQQILSQLLKEYSNNLNQIEQKIDIRNDILNSSLKLLKYKTENPEHIIQDSLDAHLFRTSIRPTFDPELSVSNELINSGKLYILENINLRNNVSSFSSYLSELREEKVIIVNLTEERLIPFLIENYQIGGMQMFFMDDKEIREKFTIGSLKEYKSTKDLVSKSDFKPLLIHPDFEDYLFQMISFTSYTNEQSEGVKEKIESIVDMIKKEVEN
ncbi:DUF6090 family protein [Formosa sp. PL04]|uniref:DUF6090 family protein n=1 Tax=Formosa sp. PL04 TaxID=3081755 RepID=UPI002980D3CD|nr:DUF6090 family protein [Formosa sp. PL04]MDW5290580.1 DUF6090 family protein [Formosa sp. PL04]